MNEYKNDNDTQLRQGGRGVCGEREGTGKEEGGKLREHVREGGGERGQASICA